MTETLDLGIKFTPAGEQEKEAAIRFVNDVEEHELTVVKDDGVYRHLSVRNPKGSGFWYTILTWPGSLVIRGDMGTFAFSRLHDMFEFFRSKPGYTNVGYWAEKLTAVDRHGLKQFSEDSFREHVAGELRGWVDEILAGMGEVDDHEQRAAVATRAYLLIKAVHDEVLTEDVVSEDLAVHALAAFKHEGKYQFHDSWDWDLNEYTYQFLWCLHAIVHAINMYDATKRLVASGAIEAA
jgi:hypothetical protein